MKAMFNIVESNHLDNSSHVLAYMNGSRGGECVPESVELSFKRRLLHECVLVSVSSSSARLLFAHFERQSSTSELVVVSVAAKSLTSFDFWQCITLDLG
jgi:hypothetical protein